MIKEVLQLPPIPSPHECLWKILRIIHLITGAAAQQGPPVIFCHGGILPPSHLDYNFLVHIYGKAHKKERFPGIPSLRLGQGFLRLQRNTKCIMDYKLRQFVQGHKGSDYIGMNV